MSDHDGRRELAAQETAVPVEFIRRPWWQSNAEGPPEVKRLEWNAVFVATSACCAELRRFHILRAEVSSVSPPDMRGSTQNSDV